MPEIEEALTARLLAHTGLAALVGTKVYWDEVPQGTEPPFVVAINISDIKIQTLTGHLRIEAPTFQFTAYATTKKAAKAIGTQLKAALQDCSGVLSGITVQLINLITELSTLTRNADGTVQLYTTDLEFQVFFERSF